MNIEEAVRVLILYANNKSSCGKLPEKEHQASRVIRKFLINLKEINSIEELKNLLNEEL